MFENTNGLILEGISGTGKSTLIKKMLQHERWIKKSCISSIVLSEHQTQRVLEPKERTKGLTVNDNLELLNNILGFLESVHDRLGKTDWKQRSRTNQVVPFLLERFHLTHVYHYKHMTWDSVSDLDRRLSRLHTKVILLHMGEKYIGERIILDPDKNGWQNYLKQYGDTPAKIRKRFEEKQNDLLALAEKSCLPVLRIDTSSCTVDEIADKVFDYWGLP
ncbi:MAG: hypothetical protein JW874_09440 [Spirochaetales bacterium]|nr:hypothetical protein [Spirochaetales bacterium]